MCLSVCMHMYVCVCVDACQAAGGCVGRLCWCNVVDISEEELAVSRVSH